MEGCGTWSVRLRGAQQDGLLLLPNAGATKLSELRELVAQRAQRDEGTLLIKSGFPPKMLSAEGGPHVIISALGVTDMDTLILEWLPGTNTPEKIQKGFVCAHFSPNKSVSLSLAYLPTQGP